MTQHESSPQLDSLVARLSSSNIEDMATGLAASPQVDALWKEFPDAKQHAALVVDAKRPDPVRFGAALVLLSKDAEAFWKTDRPVIAQVFAAALKQNLAGWAYAWGWLWASDGDPVGTLGRVFIEIGPPAVPALKPLLDDTTKRSSYVGSEEATEMAIATAGMIRRLPRSLVSHIRYRTCRRSGLQIYIESRHASTGVTSCACDHHVGWCCL